MKPATLITCHDERARSIDEAKYPELWNGLIGAWVQSLSPWGRYLNNLTPYGIHRLTTGTTLSPRVSVDVAMLYNPSQWVDERYASGGWRLFRTDEFTAVLACNPENIFNGDTGIAAACNVAYAGWSMRTTGETGSSTNIRLSVVINSEGNTEDSDTITLDNNEFCVIVGRFDGANLRIDRWDRYGAHVGSATTVSTPGSVYWGPYGAFITAGSNATYGRPVISPHGLLLYSRAISDGMAETFGQAGAGGLGGVQLPFVVRRRTFYPVAAVPPSFLSHWATRPQLIC
jgi:hypothetical protein